MIIENLRNIREHYIALSMHEVVEKIDDTIRRYEKLCDDISAAAAIDGNDRVVDIIEEELDET